MQKLFILFAAVALVHMARSEDEAPAQAVNAAKSDTCSGPAGTYQPGDRYCVDETTHRVCNWGGEWIDGQCPPPSKCQVLPTDGKKVQCLEVRRNPYPTGPPPGSEFARRRRQDDNANAVAAVAAAVPSDTCSGPAGTYQPGDRYCVDETTHRVCNWGGVWIDGQCPSPSKCQVLPTDNKKVQCLEVRRNPYPTGPPAGSESARRRRDSDPSAAAKSDTCTGPSGSYQPGERYCVDDKTHRVCNWGGEWVEDKCPDDFKCMALPNDNKKVQCFKFNRNSVPYPTGPPNGQNDEPQQPQANPQPQPQPQPQPAPQPKSEEPKPAEPQPQPAPQPQPKPDEPKPAEPQPQPQPADQHPVNPSTGVHEPHDCQGGPSGTLKPGETFCSSETSYKMCHDAQLIEESCPPKAKCIKAANSNNVVCRETRKNSNDEQPPKNRS